MSSLLALDREIACCRVAKRAYSEVQFAGWEAGAAGDGDARTVARGGLDCRLRAGHGEEHTQNIWYMVVTLEVSQLETSASKFRNS